MLLPPEGACVGTRGRLRITFLPTNKVEIFEQQRRELQCCRPRNNVVDFAITSRVTALPVLQQRCRRCQPSLEQRASTRCRPRRSNELQSVADSPQQRVATCCQPRRNSELQCVVDSPQQQAATRCRPCRSSELQRSAGLTTALRSNVTTCHC